MTPVRDEYMPLNRAERDGPHMGTSMAVLTQSIQLESRLRSTDRKSKRMSSAMMTTMVRGRLGSGGGNRGRDRGPVRRPRRSAAAPAITLARLSSSRLVSVISGAFPTPVVVTQGRLPLARTG